MSVLKHAFDWLLSHALLTPDRGGINPDQQARITYFRSSAASARDGQQRIAPDARPQRREHPFVTRAREETR